MKGQRLHRDLNVLMGRIPLVVVFLLVIVMGEWVFYRNLDSRLSRAVGLGIIVPPGLSHTKTRNIVRLPPGRYVALPDTTKVWVPSQVFLDRNWTGWVGFCPPGVRVTSIRAQFIVPTGLTPSGNSNDSLALWVGEGDHYVIQTGVVLWLPQESSIGNPTPASRISARTFLEDYATKQSGRSHFNGGPHFVIRPRDRVRILMTVHPVTISSILLGSWMTSRIAVTTPYGKVFNHSLGRLYIPPWVTVRRFEAIVETEGNTGLPAGRWRVPVQWSAQVGSAGISARTALHSMYTMVAEGWVSRNHITSVSTTRESQNRGNLTVSGVVSYPGGGRP